ncbi:hypothetical protein P7H55_09450 [Vagococcus lutrae]|uniref:hypothetical protein n=1 Tax=Vagococcus lutrae TaxID=81947 RepID=UPI00289078EA|nr:hypothetical protein [Vagococcus lutrae]MDT2818064.1 hypothetical protein [Vagococcus lutrae]
MNYKNNEQLENLFSTAVTYAVENNVKKIIIFAKAKDNVLKLKQQIGTNDIELIVTTFPMNQALYLENDEGEIEEVYPDLYNQEDQKILKDEGIKIVSSTLPFDPIIIPGHNSNPYSIIKRTLNLFGEGIDLVVQSALMATDTGVIKPSERVISMNTKLFVDMTTTNSRYLFHPTKKININKVQKNTDSPI